MEVTSAKVRTVPRLADYSHEHTIRVGIVAPPGEAARVKWSLSETFAGRTVYHSLTVPHFDMEVLEIFDRR